MYLESIKKGLEKEISTPLVLNYFYFLKKVYPDFQSFEKPTDLVEFLITSDTRSTTRKSQIFSILIDSYQRRGDSLWSSILILGCMPWLSSCYLQMKHQDVYSESERSMMVIESLLEAADSITPTEKENGIAIVGLLLSTRKKLFRQIAKDKQAESFERLQDVEDSDLIANSPVDPEKLLLISEDYQIKTMRDVFEVIERHSNDKIDIVDLLTKTLFFNVQLTDYLREHLGHDSPDFNREYERTKKIVTKERKKIEKNERPIPEIEINWPLY